MWRICCTSIAPMTYRASSACSLTGLRVTMRFKNRAQPSSAMRCATDAVKLWGRSCGSPQQAKSTNVNGAMKDCKTWAPLSWQRYTFDRLDVLREAWSEADAPPPGVGVLSSGEYVALAVACGFERVLRNPVVAFLLLDGWLQCWVMHHRGMAHLVGTRIGVDEFE